MPKKGANVSLSSYDDLFSTEQSRTEAGQEHVQEIPLEELHPFEGHPFKVLDNEEMDKTVESVRTLGIVTPLIARPDPEEDMRSYQGTGDIMPQNWQERKPCR